MAVAVDLSICTICASSLPTSGVGSPAAVLYHLVQQRTGVRALDAILFRVASITVESAVPSLLAVTLSLAFYFYMDVRAATGSRIDG